MKKRCISDITDTFNKYAILARFNQIAMHEIIQAKHNSLSFWGLFIIDQEMLSQAKFFAKHLIKMEQEISTRQIVASIYEFYNTCQSSDFAVKIMDQLVGLLGLNYKQTSNDEPATEPPSRSEIFNAINTKIPPEFELPELDKNSLDFLHNL
ncbi:MAG: hypothetical protein K0S11_954 [Gammaproteobacteria bacterium]|jgi:uncharacterized protein (UPF0335 family)|nr:hypothetical protein [Gammaproteobacteria bacterium]